MTDWLIDRSALWKPPRSPQYEVLLDRINRGQVRGSLPTRLEVAVSARDPDHWPVLHRDLLAPLLASIAVVERLTVLHDGRDFDRIREVYGAPDGERPTR